MTIQSEYNKFIIGPDWSGPVMGVVTISNLTFEKLDKNKQHRIIKAAMEEFAKRGYDDASTNEIVKQAGIGKGRLFHYFNTKEDLFKYLCTYVNNLIREEFITKIDIEERDIFERLKQAYFLKAKVIKECPWVFDFGKVMLASEENIFIEGYKKLYENIDTSKFREGIDIKKSIEIITWGMEGYRLKILGSLKETSGGKDIDLNIYIHEFEEYLAILRECFYQ